ncbi:MAG: 30S ribosomal protein S12 methylthiotransferase accessory factor YcaO [Hydrogenovibrio sp.]|uniref:30S ribosomal protein S12 methylthiotransferase accessory factor YcaO n=1 Tax=Hydrogenovibrio sp. TaxID=2065821 RepID=UPI0028701D0E|nr:30S ribosomal protein S12 methylthiotransferase accessory factor YcaO [Hydrogenovibrio sp.]MDR9497643.1 30S ribosomal protein S12 methylthiotransferase accessory factor YcaO [Hydrogenovibrio sp.]
MTERTQIIGKDACLEDSIARMQSSLTELGFEIEQAKAANPVDNVYWLHIRDRFCPALFTNGKGASRKATLASALGEYLERLQTNYFFSDYFLCAHKTAPTASDWLYFPDEKRFPLEAFRDTLTPELWALYDPEDELVGEDLLSLNDQADAIRCLPLQAVSRQKTVYFPANLLSNFYASNGLSAGNSFEEAETQGLSEVLERWVKARILRENLCLPEVPETVLEEYPVVARALAAMREQGVAVSVRDASLGGRFPVINVTLFDQKNGRCFASFGAHPLFEVALERSMTEALQGRSLNDLDGFDLPIFDETLVASDENIENHFIDSSGWLHARFISHQPDFDFVYWQVTQAMPRLEDVSTSAVQRAGLIDLIEKELSSEVFIARYQFAGLPACRIVVPGVSEVFPLTELLDNNQNRGRQLREALFDLADTQDYAQCYHELESLAFADHQGVANLVGLLPDPDTIWKKMTISDLRVFLLLKLQAVEEALEAVEIASIYQQDPDWQRFYQALAFALEAQLEPRAGVNQKALQATLFGQQRVDEVWAHLDGAQFLFDAPIGEAMFAQSQAHQALCAVHERLRPAKAEAMPKP